MEGVILSGTGPLARLDGWTACREKPGQRRKIDPATGRYSRTQLIASFTGFAPISNPAVTILVSLDSPVGQHEGGQVAAPVFKRIAEQVLPYLDVPRDVPIGPRLVQASYRNREVADSSVLEDFRAPRIFRSSPTNPPREVPRQTNSQEGSRSRPVATVAVDEGGDLQVPDFSGEDDAGCNSDLPSIGARAGSCWQRSCNESVAGPQERKRGKGPRSPCSSEHRRQKLRSRSGEPGIKMKIGIGEEQQVQDTATKSPRHSTKAACPR